MKRTSPFIKLTVALLLFCTLLYIFRILTHADPVTARSGNEQSAKTSSVVVRGNTMGTTYAITISELLDPQKLPEIRRAIQQRLVMINNIMSTYIADSELSRFNQSQVTDWIPVSDELLYVVQLAQSISKKTGGAFDITVGPAVNLWHFGPGQKSDASPKVPDEDQVQQVLSHIGYQSLHLQNKPPAMRKDHPELAVDLSAIAKGYGVDQIAVLLNSFQPHIEYMVEIGGEIRTRSHQTNGRQWLVGIQNPATAPGKPSKIVRLQNHAIATSGDYVNYYEIDGIRYSHTINPLTARPVRHDLASTIVITDTCAAADAWATALLVLGPQQAYDISTEQGLAVMLITRSGDQLRSRTTKAMQKLIAAEGTP